MRVERRVWITIEDAQTDAEGEQRHGTVKTQGTLTETPDGRTLVYEDDDGTRVRVQATGETVRVTRRGEMAMDMLFRAGENHAFDYETPHGALPMHIETDDARWRADERGGEISLRYALHVGGQFATRNALDLRWCAEGEGADARQ